MNTGRLNNIQALRGLAALLVLGAHVTGADADYGGAAILPDQFRIGVAGVDLFFLISGFVMVFVAGKMTPGRQNALRFTFNRAARVYPLYWVATVAMMIFYWGKLQVFGEATETGALIQSFLLLPQNNLPILIVGWTLVHEIYFYLVFALILFIAPNRMPLMLLGWGAIIAIANLAGVREANAWTALMFSPMSFEFLAGAGVAMLIGKTGARWGIPALVAGVSLFTIQMFFFDNPSWTAMSDHGARALNYTAPFAFMLYGAAAIEQENNKTAPRWLIATGDASYSLYLFHLPVALVVGKLISVTVGDHGIIDNIAIIIAIIAGAIAVGFLVHRFIERPLLALTKSLGDRLIAESNNPLEQKSVW